MWMYAVTEYGPMWINLDYVEDISFHDPGGEPEVHWRWHGEAAPKIGDITEAEADRIKGALGRSR